MLAVVNGPLTGTEVTMSGRLAFVTKSPLTGTVTDSHMGGWSAARLRWAGFDALLITGKADLPVYLHCENNTVEIRDASAVWGLGVHDTVKHFGSAKGNATDVSVMAIGPGRRERRAVRLVHERRRPRRRPRRHRRRRRREKPQVHRRRGQQRGPLGARSGAPSGTSSAPPSAPISA